MDIRDGHSIICYRDPGINSRFKAAYQLFSGDHTTPALDNHGIFFHIPGDTVEPGYYVNSSFLPVKLLNQRGILIRPISSQET